MDALHLSASESAAENNAFWCEAVCAAHGVPGVFSDGVWVTRERTPRFYPNMITFRKGRNANAVGEIKGVLDAMRNGSCSVKDSFCELDLEDWGFCVLFEASWIRLVPPGNVAQARIETDIIFRGVPDARTLQRWESAWRIHPGGGGAGLDGTIHPVQFPSSLALQPSIQLVAGYRGDCIVAGGILNVAAACVGVSNVFCDPADTLATWSALIRHAEARYPGMPLVGYEQPDSLQTPVSLGFCPVGQLRVWGREAAVHRAMKFSSTRSRLAR